MEEGGEETREQPDPLPEASSSPNLRRRGEGRKERRPGL
jgi:hypothetical protein